MAKAHIVHRDDEITVIHVPNGRAAIPVAIVVYAVLCAVLAPRLEQPDLLLVGFPFLVVLIGVLWFQHKTVVAMPQGVEVSYGPLPWPGTLIRRREILAIEVDANPQRYSRNAAKFGDDDGVALLSVGRSREGKLLGFRPSVDAYLKDAAEVTLVNSANVRDKAHALELRDALRDGMDRSGEIAFED